MIAQDLIIDYDLVRGLPGVVAERVQELIGSCEGWQPVGELIKMTIDGCEIVIQRMEQRGEIK